MVVETRAVTTSMRPRAVLNGRDGQVAMPENTSSAADQVSCVYANLTLILRVCCVLPYEDLY
jgi:hypothetical protein